MRDFEQIEALLSEIVDSGYRMLNELEKEDIAFNKVRSLLEIRGEQINKLKHVKVSNDNFSEPERKELKNLFTRFTLLEKRINTILGKLSLISKTSLKEVALHKKAKKSYRSPFRTSRFLNAQVTG